MTQYTHNREQLAELDLEDITKPATPPDSTTDTTSSDLGFVGSSIRDAANVLVRDPKFLIPAGAAALGAGALFRTGQRIANIGSGKDKDQRKKGSGFVRNIAGLGLAGAGAYGAYKLMNKKPVSENANPYGAALKPSSVLGGTGALAAGLAAFPVADALTAGIPNEGLRAAANIGAKALLSTVGSGLAGYGGYKAGREIEKAQARAQEKEYKKRNQYLPDFYYNNVG